MRATLPAADVDRLCKALSIVFGIEPYVVLKDIWGCGDEEIERISFWIATSLLASIQTEVSGRTATGAKMASLQLRGGSSHDAEPRRGSPSRQRRLA